MALPFEAPEAEPQVIQAIRSFRERLLSREAATTQAMAAQWQVLEYSLYAEMEAVADSIAQATAAGQQPTTSDVITLERYARFIEQLKGELGNYTDYAAYLIEQRQEELARLGLSNAVDAINYVYAGFGYADLIGAFDVLPISAIESIVGLAGDGSPLDLLLRAAWPDTYEAIEAALIQAVAFGINPRMAAAEMRQIIMAAAQGGMAEGLRRAMVIARTEMLRAYRVANQMQYQQSGVVQQYKRLSARDNRVCPACIILDGTFWPVTRPLEDHPQGRCTAVPVVDGMPPINWQPGREWLQQQPEQTQVDILGRGRYEGLREGLFTLDDIVSYQPNDIWGGMFVAKPLYELIPQNASG